MNNIKFRKWEFWKWDNLNIHTILNVDEDIYVGTNNGLYYKKYNQEFKQLKIEQNDITVENLATYKEIILIGTNKGLYYKILIVKKYFYIKIL